MESNEDKKNKGISFNSASTAFTETINTINMRLNFKMPAFSFSLISDTPQEVMHIWIEGLEVSISKGSSELETEATIKRIQVDNQLFNTPYYNVLSSVNNNLNTPFLSFKLNKSLEYNNLSYFNEIDIKMENCIVHVDEAFLTHLIYNVHDIIDFLNDQKENSYRLKNYVNTSQSLTDMAYFRKFDIANSNLSLSYISSKKHTKRVSDKKSLQRIFKQTSKIVKNQILFFFFFLIKI